MNMISAGRKTWCQRIKAAIILEGVILLMAAFILWENTAGTGGKTVTATSDGTIRWVDFNVSYEALCKAYECDVDTYGSEMHIDWIDLLSYVAAKNGGEFGATAVSELNEAAEKVKNKELTFDEAAEKLKYFSYYKEAYSAVLGGLVGEYEIQESEGGPYVKKYGLKAFSPIAKGFPYSDYDDFGVSRSYGYKRQHLGHDMMGQIGTPVICIETGYVEALGWNQYGGWRVGIRSPDKKRYYYYAHLRQDYPYHAPILPDIGMFASFDPVALDQACADACLKTTPIENSQLGEHLAQPGWHCHHDHFKDSNPNIEWEATLDQAEKIGLGTRQYELKRIK